MRVPAGEALEDAGAWALEWPPTTDAQEYYCMSPPVAARVLTMLAQDHLERDCLG